VIISHSKKIDAGIINDTVRVYSSSYQRGDYNGKATALVSKAIKGALSLQSKRNSKK
jgi:hypothetical protein